MTQVWASKESGFDFVGNFMRPEQAQNSRVALQKQAIPSAAVVTLSEEFYKPDERFSKVIHAGEHAKLTYHWADEAQKAEFLARVENGVWTKPGD